MSSSTPRTDYEEQRLDAWQAGERFVKSSLARRLEIELSAALARVAELTEEIGKAQGIYKEYQKGMKSIAIERDNYHRQLSESQAETHFIRKQRDDYREDRNKANDYIERLGRILGSTCGDDTPEKLIRELQAQLASAREDGARLDWYEANWEKVFQRIAAPGYWYFDPFAERQTSRPTLRSAIDSARGHLAETPAGRETGKDAWQDIATAPKDGTRVLVIANRFNDPKSGTFQEVAVWDSEEGYWGRGTDDDLEEIHPPHHWQPLPPPPQGKEQE